jgi:hypothetical protein
LLHELRRPDLSIVIGTQRRQLRTRSLLMAIKRPARGKRSSSTTRGPETTAHPLFREKIGLGRRATAAGEQRAHRIDRHGAVAEDTSIQLAAFDGRPDVGVLGGRILCSIPKMRA